jgi:isoquinoline 1-oxidoreductase subunit beta
MDRRRFITTVVKGATTLTIAGRFVGGTPAAAQLPGLPGLPGVPGLPDGLLDVTAVPGPTASDFYDLGDALVQAAAPTNILLTLEITEDGGARFELPRMEVGQGIDTTIAMMIADELGVDLSKVTVVLADARPELFFNQLTGGSYNVRNYYQPVRRMAATAREAMVAEASRQLGVPAHQLTAAGGVVAAPGGAAIPYGSLSQATAAMSRPLDAEAKPVSEHTLLGTPTGRTDGPAIVTGQKVFALDVPLEGAVPTLSVHPPTIRATIVSADLDAIRAMPGIRHAELIRAVPHAGYGEAVGEWFLSTNPTAIVIGADTFGHALAAEQAIKDGTIAVAYTPGPQAGRGDDEIWADIRALTPPTSPDIPGVESITREFEFAHVAHAPMETMSATASVTDTSAEVWSGLKIPIPAQQEISELLGLPITAVTVHVVPSGGSFGRRLFHEAALEAALASRAFGNVPVKLMWSRAEDMKNDRLRPATYHKITSTRSGSTLLSFEHRFGSGATTFSHGLGDALSSVGAHDPLTQQGVAQSIFTLQMTAPYDLGVITQVLNEVDLDMNTGSWRSVYTGTGRTVEEIVIDEIAAELGVDPLDLRLQTAKEEGLRRCLEWLRTDGGYGRPDLPAGTVQGIAGNSEHRSNMACLVEMVALPPGSDPFDPDNEFPVRVTRAAMAFDAGIVMNPLGLEAQLISGLNDGIATILRASIHIVDGAVRESAFSDFKYPRQRHSPLDVAVHVFPSNAEDADVEPGGAGEISVPTTAGAVANAYARLSGAPVRRFPVNH